MQTMQLVFYVFVVRFDVTKNLEFFVNFFWYPNKALAICATQRLFMHEPLKLMLVLQ